MITLQLEQTYDDYDNDDLFLSFGRSCQTLKTLYLVLGRPDDNHWDDFENIDHFIGSCYNLEVLTLVDNSSELFLKKSFQNVTIPKLRSLKHLFLVTLEGILSTDFLYHLPQLESLELSVWFQQTRKEFLLSLTDYLEKDSIPSVKSISLLVGRPTLMKKVKIL